jgi:hypothetical protein
MFFDPQSRGKTGYSQMAVCFFGSLTNMKVVIPTVGPSFALYG